MNVGPSLIALISLVTLASCGLFAIFGGTNGAPFVLIFTDDDVAVTNGTITLANGDSITLTLNASDPDGNSLTVQWYVDGTLRGSVTGSTFTFSESPSAQTQYVIEVTVSDGSLSTTATVTITVEGPPAAVSISPATASANSGDSVVLTATPSSSWPSTITYEWYVDDVLEVGETGSTFSFSRSPVSATTYVVKVIIDDGSNTAEDTSSITFVIGGVTLNVPTTTASYGETVYISTTVVGLTGTVSYSWYLDNVWQSFNEGWSDYYFTQYPFTTTTYDVKVEVTDGTITAEHTVTITVLDSAAGTVATPTITPDRSEDDVGNGEYNELVTIALATSTSGATICYTTNYTTPTTSSNLYDSIGGIPLTGNVDFYVRAFRTGWPDSNTVYPYYNVAVGTPVADILGGTILLLKLNDNVPVGTR